MSCAGATAADGIADGITADADGGAGASAAQTPSDTALGVWGRARARAGLPHRHCSYTRRGTKRESLMITIQ
jgi:hypothetical protein